ncbi:HAMP domain-containing sensor histidine kinase [Cytophagaceae bacterium YF14B1]|uniref:histidine kinase n=1 Tax=Xanthocytophaga flava TaxID=3048013 RepID=A0AAE3QXF6_9BACT|nr:HAMP domain-containing sensor histidine kinase [Xanthocytophaga flavus]MDJ1484268.1 HAMP domain-containing sensor histidine kinase [Xanthocytophaga flavus]
MKLLTKASGIYLLFLLSLYLITALAFYWITRVVIYDEVESRLQVEKRDFEAYIQLHQAWSSSCYFVENKIEVVPVTYKEPITEMYKDTLIYNRYEDQDDPFRQITFYTKIGNADYKVSIRKSLIQTYKLIEVITFVMVTFLSLLLILMYWFQRRLSGNLWKPFYNTLSKIKQFDLTSVTPIDLKKEEVDEFDELNQVLKRMAEKMQHDYRSLKEFTENASHEIQTPLALINVRVEQLLQSSSLSQQQTYWIDEIYQASRRMSRLHQGLLLLTKIENHQFRDAEQVNLTELAKNKVLDFEEFLIMRQLTVDVDLKEPFLVNISPALADSLVNNLLSNAIKYSKPEGILRIFTHARQLCIYNSGEPLKNDPEKLFDRFKKDSDGSESLGLGLAIVKQICENYQLQLQYTYSYGMHCFCVSAPVSELS